MDLKLYTVRELFRLPRWALVLGIPLVVIASFLVVWAVDEISHRGRVARNVEVAGETVGGLSSDALRARLGAMSNRIAGTRINVVTELGTATWSASQLGISLDTQTTYDAVMASRGSGSFQRPIDWLSSLASNVKVPAAFSVNRQAFEATLGSSAGFQRAPVEPSIQVNGGQLELVPGKPGKRIDLDNAFSEISRSLQYGGLSSAQVSTIDSAPAYDDAAVAQLVAEANQSIRRELTLRLNDYQTVIAPHVVASWFDLQLFETTRNLTLNKDQILEAVEEILIPGNTGAGQAQFEIRDDNVEIISSDGGTACCSAEASEIVATALTEGRGPITLILPNRPATPREAVNRLEALGITEKVSSFTTLYACCVGRVTNIQKFAELMNGIWIKPGGSLSLNETVGRRTEEKGFVPGGFISKGHLVEDIGGGVSQFATTIFNAAVRAGLDFDFYQAHSIYFDRYPYGLEATISYPRPDLVIANPTDYGVLIWNSWTDESITVDMYSTKNVEVIIEEPTEKPFNECTRVTTERIRRWSGGSDESDYFYATYRPEEGLNCDGTPSDPDQTTTTIPDEPVTDEDTGDHSSNSGEPQPSSTTSTSTTVVSQN